MVDRVVTSTQELLSKVLGADRVPPKKVILAVGAAGALASALLLLRRLGSSKSKAQPEAYAKLCEYLKSTDCLAGCAYPS